MAASSKGEELPPLKQGEVDLGDYRVLVYPPIGSGAFGRVCSAFHTKTFQKIAAKGIDFDNDYMKSAALDEGRQATSISHPNIVQFFDIFIDTKTVWLFMEFCELGNLAQYMDRNWEKSLKQKCLMMYDLTDALIYLHQHKPRIIHRDIKPENVVITKVGDRDVAKLTDFGHAKIYDYNISRSTRSGVSFYLRQNTSLKGTPNYMAPEFYLEEETGLKYTATVDIFSLGLLFAVMMEYGPFQNSTMPLSVQAKREKKSVIFGYEMADNFKKGKPLPCIVKTEPGDCEEVLILKDCILRMTAFRSGERTSLDDTKKALEAILGEDHYYYVVALELGLKFSSYAYSSTNQIENIYMNKNLANEAGHLSYGTASSVLTDQNGKFVSFGFDAEAEYASNLVEGESHRQEFRLFRGFPELLYSDLKLDVKSQMKEVEGKATSPALTIFSHALRYLKQHYMHAINMTISGSYSDEMIRWVVTVPSPTTEETKQFLREAALNAGLIRSQYSRQLVIAFESEAAFLCCRNMRVTQYSDQSVSLRQLSNHLVVNAQADRVTITAYEVQVDGTTKELCNTKNAIVNGDAEFINFLRKVLGKTFVETFPVKCPDKWEYFMRKFEVQKSVFSSDTQQGSININLPWRMEKDYEDITGGKKLFDTFKTHNIDCTNGMLRLKNDTLRSLFNPMGLKIISLVNDYLATANLGKSCEVIFFVGELSTTKFYRKMMKEKFHPGIQVLIPCNSSLVTIQGAVLYGHHSF